MAYEHKPNSFSLFKNDKKSKDTDCDYSGTLKVGDVEYWINGWHKENGNLVMSGNIKIKNFSGEAKYKPAETKQDDNFSDDVPW